MQPKSLKDSLGKLLEGYGDTNASKPKSGAPSARQAKTKDGTRQVPQDREQQQPKPKGRKKEG